ncbi:MAG: DUF805 domain-containing protein [Sphingopyxis sp.]
MPYPPHVQGEEIMDWMLMAWKKYADFSGRARRKEYWMFVLGYIIMVIIASIVDGVLGMTGMIGGVYGPLVSLVGLAALVPSIAVGVRRLHDQDKSGWFMLLALIPLVNIVLLVFMCLEGTSGPNQYGPDPKGSDAATFS